MTRSASATARSTAPRVRRERDDAPPVDLIDEAQPIEVLVQEHHLGLHAGGDPCGVPTDVAGSEDDDARVALPARLRAAPPAPVVALEVVRADLGRDPSRHLAHRGEQRQRAVGELHRLVRDAGRARREECLRDVGIRREVQVGEQGEVGPKHCELRLLRLLHLHHHLLRPRIGCRRDDRRPRSLVVAVGDRRVLARASLDVHLDAVVLELAHPVWSHRHAMFSSLDLARHTDSKWAHVRTLPTRRSASGCADR